MTRRPTLLALLITAVLALAACSSGGSSAAPAASAAPGASAPAASGSTGGATCTTSTAAATVQVSMKDIAFAPASVAAKVGDVIGFTNNDSVDHTATLDDGSCSTDTLKNGQSGALTISAPGSYPFHCKIHPNMTGTITVS